MDAFTYTIKMKEIDTLKTLKSKDEMVRTLLQEITDSGYHNLNSNAIQSVSMLYKCITKILLTYDAERLPQTVNRSIDWIQKYLVQYYCKVGISYNTFIDTFQFVSEIEVYSGDRASTAQLVSIFQDNPIPFNINYRQYTDSKYSYVLNDCTSNVGNTGSIFQLEELKRGLPSTIRYSILEDLLDKTYSELLSNATKAQKEAYASEAITHMENLVTVAKTFKERLLRD